jgi:hypothetical protein
MSTCLNTNIENVKRNHPDYGKIYKKAYRKIHPTYMKDCLDKHSEYYERHKEEISVSAKAKYAISKGRINKPKICSSCGKKRRILAHHPDYRYPFKVQFLCYSCHKLIHIKEA